MLWTRIYLEEKALHEGTDPKDVSEEQVVLWYAWTMKLFLVKYLPVVESVQICDESFIPFMYVNAC